MDNARTRALEWLWKDSGMDKHMPVETFGPYRTELSGFQIAEMLESYTEEMREGLRKYGATHLSDCAKYSDPVYGRTAYQSPDIACTCGLEGLK